jgi:nucleotide-binding universal stress UspA family protein
MARVELRRILCPVDFSEASRHALEHALVLAKWYEAPITALHVIYAPRFQPPILMAGVVDPRAAAPPDYNEREKDLQALLEPARQLGIEIEAVVEPGLAASRILEYALSRQADLIVMGTHGLSGFERFMLGSVAEKVIRKAACAVLTVPPAAMTRATVPYTRVLCPVDFSDSSLAALRFASSLAEEADANLQILHVIDWPDDDDGLLLEGFDSPELRGRLEGEARGRLEALITDDIRMWCKPSTKVAHGKPYREILQTAQEEGADLIVVGVRGRTPVDLMVFGSTTNQVVRRAPCPVLTLRGDSRLAKVS